MGKFTRRIQEQTGGSAASPQQGTYIASTSDLEGTFTFTGATVVAGKITGDIRATDLLVIEEGGEVVGDIAAVNLIVKGKVTGKLTATELIELGATSRFRGTVSAPALRVVEGAQFKAAMDVSEEGAPTREDLDNITPIRKRAAAASPEDTKVREGDVIIPAPAPPHAANGDSVMVAAEQR